MKYQAGFETWADYFGTMAHLKDAYEAFERSERHAADLEWNDPLRIAIQDAGRRLDELGGYEAMCAAQRNLFPDDDVRTRAAGMALGQLWTGIGNWRE